MEPTWRRTPGRALAALALATVLVTGLAGCGPRAGATGPGTGSGATPSGPRTATPTQLAQLEAGRAASVPALASLLAEGDAAAQLGALRALGRIGGPAAVDVLVAAVVADDLAVVAGAAAALGIVVATQGAPEEADLARIAEAIAAAGARAGVDRVVVAEALGRGGAVEGALPVLTAWVADADLDLAETAGFALGRLGRRKLALDEGARAALRARVADAEPRVRYAVLYALAREQRAADAPADAATVRALMSRMVDPEPEIRATVIAGLSRRNALGDAEPLFVAALEDVDGRVKVEAVRALAGEAGSDAGRDKVAARLLRWAHDLPRIGVTPHVHALLEGLRTITGSARRKAIATALHGVVLEAESALSRKVPAGSSSAGWTHCLAMAALERARPASFDAGTRLLACGGGQVSRADQAALLAEASLGIRDDGEPARSRAPDVMIALLSSSDPRVRAAGLGMVGPVWAMLDEANRGLVGETLAVALASKTPVEAAAAASALGALLQAVPTGQTPPATLDRSVAALIARAGAETDPELAAAFLEAIAGAELRTGIAACTTASSSSSPVRARAGRDCARALGGSADGPSAAPAPPPVELEAVIGKAVRWTVTTTRGAIVMELDPRAAPWNVASLVSLTRRGFFDGLVVHRVVPDFVVQTGDPTGTGWGGPGYAAPSEPSAVRDGHPFAAGAVGIADAGKDSGGSQWFIMNARSPHLEGTYTQVGHVVSGQDVADQLIVGDKITTATVELR